MNRILTLSIALIFVGVTPRVEAYNTENVNGVIWYYEKKGQSVSLGYNDTIHYYTAVSTKTKGNLTIPATLGGCNVSSISDYAFKECTNLTSVTMPETITSIGQGAFQSCTQLTNINLSSGLKEIGQHVFNSCRQMVSIVLPNGVTNVSDYAFSNCTGLENVVIPNSVVSIGSHSFYNCARLRHLTIPSSIRNIGYCAFLACTSLEAIEFEGNTPSVNGSAFVFGTSINSNCCAYVRKDSSGWGVDLPGIWNKILIDYARYMISFEANGGEGIMLEQTICLGEITKLFACNFSHGYGEFGGWALDANGDVVYSDNENVKDIAQTRNDTIKLYAIWRTCSPSISTPDVLTFNNSSQEVSITCETAGAKIYYSLDGSNPVENGLEYRHSFLVYSSCLVRAIAIKNGLRNSLEKQSILTRAEPLSEAVNLYGYLLETDENKPWTVMTDVSHDGVSCVKSGAIGHGGTTWLQTSVRKAGTVSFWWKAACEEAEEEDGETYWYDYGSFLLDGVSKAQIAGNDTGWQFVSVDVPSGGKHVLRWEYTKDSATSYSPDCIWLDQVQWIPADGSGYTLTTPEPVPYAWLTSYGLGIDTDFETAAKQTTGKLGVNGRQMAVWQDFVAGTNPTDANDFLRAMIAISNGMPYVSWTPNLNTNGEVRVYTVMGKTNLTDAAWACPTNAAHRFFKVKVEMP